jgi:hypothetical protein
LPVFLGKPQSPVIASADAAKTNKAVGMALQSTAFIFFLLMSIVANC